MTKRKTINILLVQDEPSRGLRIKMALQAQGWQVQTEDRLDRVIERTVVDQPDIVLVDAGALGLPVVKKLRSDSLTKRSSIVIVTERAELGLKLAALEAGADDYLSHPVDMPELLARMRQQLKIAFLRREAVHAAQLQAVRDMIDQIRLELNNPLCVIKGGAQLLERRLLKIGEGAKLAEMAAGIGKAAEEIVGKVDYLTNVASIISSQSGGDTKA